MAESDGEKPPEAPPPAYVTKEELAAQGETLLARIEGMLAGARAATPAATVHEPADAPLDFDSLDAAVSEGRPGAAQKIAELAGQIADRRVKQALKERVEPLQNYGSASLASLARDRGLARKAEELGPNGGKYVKQYTKEIDAFMSTMGPDVKSDLDAWGKAASLVIGQHMPEIMQAETEAAHRRGLGERPDPSSVGDPAPLKDDDGTPLPKFEDLFGADNMKALAEKGIRTPDELAQRLGYKNAHEYVKLARRIDTYSEDLI